MFRQTMPSFSAIRPTLSRYGLALLSVTVAIAVRHTLTPIVGVSAAPFATVTAAVMLTAWLAGTGPAAVVATVGLVAADWYFLAPTFAFQGHVNIVHLATYLVVSGSALLLSASYQRSSARYSVELQRREARDRELLQERDALYEAEEKFRAVAEVGSSAIFIHDGRRALYMNRASEELFGYTRDELLAGGMWQIVHPDYRELLRERAAARFRGEQVPDRYEIKIITKSGEERWLDASARLISFEGKACILQNAFDITDRKHMEEALRNREEHYRAAIDAGKVGTWEWDVNQNKLFASAVVSTLSRVHGFTGAEKIDPYMTRDQWRELVHEDDLPRVEAAIQSALEHDTKYDVEFRVRQKGTSDVRWLASSGRVLRDNAGNPLRMLGAAADVTDNKRAEEALRNREEHYRAAIEAGKIGTWEWDIAQDKIIISDKIYEFTGIDKTATYVTFEQWMEPIHKDDRPRVDAAIQSALERDEKYEAEFRVVQQGTNEVRWVVSTGRVLRDNAGKPLRMLGAAVDVTERRRAEEAVRNREEHYRLAIAAGKVGTWEWDISQNKVVFSDNWYSLTSTLDRKYEFAGRGKTRPYMDFAVWREAVHEDDRPKVDAAIESALKHDTKYDVEFRVRQKGTNEVRWLAGLGRILRDSAGNPLRMIGAAVDVTERRRAEEALRNSEKLAAAGRLAACIAHEINNPLEAVTNLVFLARTAGGPNAKGGEFLAMAEEELRRAAHLTKRTLGFYRDSTSPTHFNVAEVIDDVLSLYAGRIEARRVQVTKHYVDPAGMQGMIGEIRQAISNLVANALDAMPNSGGTLHIRVRRTRQGQNGSALRITVADNGMGIPTELQKRIFEPFFTTKQETGTGLGLWLTKNIVEKHGGTIRVSSSNTGKTGTVFVLTLRQGDFHCPPAASAG